MRWWLAITAAILAGGLATACGPREPACPEPAEGSRFLTAEELALARQAPPAPFLSPVEIEIGRTSLQVDKVVSGPLCADEWRGTVYVTCDARVAEWSETPLFLKDCNLSIAEGTVVYVAAHYNAPYYEGCSCHTGEIGEPQPPNE